jgi:ABC-2 type transport system permease protein
LKKFLSIVTKEFVLLFRDIPGLVILFVMPAVLLILITLTQESAILKDKSGIKIILVNSDSSVFGDTVMNDIARSGSFNITRFASAAEAEKAVMKGTYQLAVIIPDSSTEKLYNLVKTDNVQKGEPQEKINTGLSDVKFIYDPAVRSMYKDAVFVPLKLVINMSALKVLMSRYADVVRKIRKEQFSDFASNFNTAEIGKSLPDFPYKAEILKKFQEELARKADQEPEMKLPANPLFMSEILRIDEHVAIEESATIKPNPLQNNVPAFTLFAMFFIVIPLAGSIISEKNQGVHARLRTLPVSYLSILSGKILVFLIVCVFQFIALMAIGEYVMPLISNLTSLDLRVDYLALLITMIASGLAATGFGIIVGTFAGNHSQAATFGSVMIVILAWLGGIFVPVHMLPETIRKISMVSPLRWGTDAFLGVFTRYEGIGGIWFQLSLLIGFFSISLILSVRMFDRRK